MGHHQLDRVITICILLVVLSGLFVWAGTIEPDPADNNYPDTKDIYENPSTYVGDQVSVGGTVIETDPLTIEDEPIPGETITVTVRNANQDVAIGDHLIVFGTLRENNHVSAETTVHREPWEAQYMYVVSFLGGLWVLARLLNNWTVDTTTWSVVPRTTPLVTITD